MKNNIKLVLFDFDDTLVGTIGTKWQQHKHVARLHYNKELTDPEILQHWGKPFREYLGLIFETDDINGAVHANAIHESSFPKTALGPLRDLLTALKENIRSVGVVTASARKNFEHDLALVGVPLGLFDYVQTEEDTVFHKPDQRVFGPVHALIAQRGIYPSEVVYIGDSLQDYYAASGAGFEFLGVETGIFTSEDFRMAGATSIRSINQLLNLPMFSNKTVMSPNVYKDTRS